MDVYCVCMCINSCLLGDYVYGRILYSRFCLLKIYMYMLISMTEPLFYFQFLFSFSTCLV